MDFNYKTETIIPDNTYLTNLLITIGGTQAVQLPSGSQSQRPPAPAAGMLRFTTANNTLEYYNGTSWFSLVSTSGTVTSFSAGSTGLTPAIASTGNITLGGTLTVGNGGTGLSTSPANGQLLIGNATGYTLSTLTPGTGISITNNTGSITIGNTGIVAINGTANQITASTVSGTTTLSIPTQLNVTNVTASGQVLLTSATVNAAGTNQGTATALTAQNNLVNGGTGGVVLPAPSGAGLYVTIENRSGALISIYPNSGGQIETFGTNTATVLANSANITLVSSSTTQYWIVDAAVTAGTNLVNSFGFGVQTLSLSTTPSVTSLTVSGLTPNSFVYPTTGGLLTSTTAATNGQLLIGSTGAAPVATTLTAGVGISVTNAAGSITIANTNATTGFVTIGASATSQGTATPLPYAYNIVNATSGGSAVILPTPTAAGQFINVENRSGAGVIIYPNVGGQIENLGTNAGLSTNVGQGGYNFIAASTTQWYFTQTLYTNGPGISLIAATSGVTGLLQFNNAGVLSFSGGTTGLTPTAATTGAITLAGSLIPANGGTGLTAGPTVNGQLLIGSSTGTYTLANIIGGTGITVTNTAGGINIAANSSAVVLSDTGTVNQILVNGTTTAQTGTNVFTIAPNVILPGTASATIPNGTTAQRPATPTVAMMRYNTTEDIIEGYSQIGTGYTNIGANALIDNIAIPKSLNYRKRRYWYDEFLFGSAPSSSGNIGAFGDMGWGNVAGVSNTATTNTGINSIITGVADHPGILSLGTAAVSGGYMALYPNLPSATSNVTTGMIQLSQIEYVSFLVRIPSLTNVNTINIGLIDNGNTGPTNTYVNALFFQYYTGLGANWLIVVYNNGTESYQNPGAAFTANTWYLLEMWNTGTTWVFAANGTVIGTVTPATGTSAAAMQPCLLIINNTAATSTSIQIDAFSMITKELGNRY